MSSSEALEPCCVDVRGCGTSHNLIVREHQHSLVRSLLPHCLLPPCLPHTPTCRRLGNSMEAPSMRAENTMKPFRQALYQAASGMMPR